MTDDIKNDYSYADAEDMDVDDVRAEVAQLAQTEGLRVAYSTSISIALDEKAPAAARGAASRTLLEMAGMLNPRDRAAAEAVRKDPSEMTGAEINAVLEDLMRRRLRNQSAQPDEEPTEEPVDEEDDPGVFG